MADRKVDLDECPVAACDADVDLAVLTTDGTKLTTANLSQERTCLHPTTMEVDGEERPASYIVFHREIDVDPPEATDTDEPTDDVDAPDPDDIEGERRTVYDRVVEATVRDGSAERGEIAGKVMSAGISPSDAGEHLDALAEAGYVTEIEADTFAAVGHP